MSIQNSRFRNPAILVSFLAIFCATLALAMSGDTGNAQALIDGKASAPPVSASMIDVERKKRNAAEAALSPPQTPHDVVAAFYDVQNFPTAKLLLNNKGPLPIEVRPTLYNLDGNIFEPSPVIVPQSSHIFVNLTDWATPAGESFRRGSLRLFYVGRDLEIGSQVYLEDSENSLSFEERLAELGKFDSRRLEAIWRIPRNQAKVTIILSNTSASTISVNVRLSKKPHHVGDVQTFIFLPHQTRVLDLRNDFDDGSQFSNAELVGISLEHNGEKSDLKAHGLVGDAPKGYSGIITFSNPNTAKSNELHGTGLHLDRLGNEKLEQFVAVKNVGTTMSRVTATVPYTRIDGTIGSVNLGSTTLSVGEMRLLNMNPAEQAGRRENIQIAGLEIVSDSGPGTVIANVQSVSDSSDHVYRVPMYDPFGQTSSTGGYPWRIEGTSTTFVYIKNTSNAEQRYVAYLKYGEDTEYMIGLKSISPHQTVQIDVRKLRDEQIPDEWGNTIPIDLESGQIAWTMYSERFIEDQPLKRFDLVGRSEQIDTVNGVSSSYACQNCCDKTAYGYVLPDFFSEPEVGETVQFRAYQEGINCGQSYGPFQVTSGISWYTTNSNIATVNGSGLATIVNAGTVSIGALWNADVRDDYDGYCPMLRPQPLISAPEATNTGFSERPLEPDCSLCTTENISLGNSVGVTTKPKVTINVPATAQDGDTVTFSATTEGGTPTAYQWTYSIASGGTGNNPQVNFSAATAPSTTALAHWYARPNSDCATSPPDLSAAHPYYNSKYKIKVKVTFQNGDEKSKEADFTVNSWWHPAGSVDVPQFAGTIQMTQNSQSQWVVTGHNLTRSPQQTPNIFVSQTSQFYAKTLAHENVHISQFNSGQIFANYVTVNSFWTCLMSLNLSSSTQAGLLAAVNTAIDNYRQTERNRARNSGDLNQAEIDAYAISDPITPMFAYQLCGRTTF